MSLGRGEGSYSLLVAEEWKGRFSDNDAAQLDQRHSKGFRCHFCLPHSMKCLPDTLQDGSSV